MPGRVNHVTGRAGAARGSAGHDFEERRFVGDEVQLARAVLDDGSQIAEARIGKIWRIRRVGVLVFGDSGHWRGTRSTLRKRRHVGALVVAKDVDALEL